LKNFFI